LKWTLIKVVSENYFNFLIHHLIHHLNFDESSDSLKIGDYVYLRDVNLGCFLSVEGIISEDLVGVTTIKDLQDSLFCIHLQRQYSAYRELNVFLEGYGMDKSKITDEGEQSYYQALEVRSDIL
jgi:hypothetical protein